MSSLHGEIKNIQEINDNEVIEMFELITMFFDGMTKENFTNDLMHKDKVILIEDDKKHIIGFSTFEIYDYKGFKIVFSGDTVVHRDFWHQKLLPFLWGKYMFTMREKEQDKRWFWFLISSGFRTYRFLCKFFEKYYPNCKECVSDDIQNLMNELACIKFKNDFIKEKGIIRFSHSKEHVKEGISEITEDQLKDPDIAFFKEKNPGYMNGDELVCLTELHPNNLNALAKRLLERKLDVAA